MSTAAYGRRERLTFGVEEEFLLADVRSRYAVPRADEVLADAGEQLGDQVTGEFFTSQLEIRSRPAASSAALRADLARSRRITAEAAERSGCLLVAAPAAILTRRPLPIREGERYLRVARHLGSLLTEADCELSGCHVHLGSLDRDEAFHLSTRLRAWLPLFQALTANSPFAAAADRGHASWRCAAYGQWPTVGPAPVLDATEYERFAEGLIADGTILDRAMIYWYARPSEHLPTLEIRVADVNADLDTTVLLAVLLRALAMNLLAEPGDDLPGSRPSESRSPGPDEDERLLAEHLRAACDGLAADLDDPENGARRPAGALLEALLARCRPALEATGDLDFAAKTLSRITTCGNGADRQRAVYARSRSWTDLVDHLARETRQGAAW